MQKASLKCTALRQCGGGCERESGEQVQQQQKNFKKIKLLKAVYDVVYAINVILDYQNKRFYTETGGEEMSVLR